MLWATPPFHHSSSESSASKSGSREKTLGIGAIVDWNFQLVLV